MLLSKLSDQKQDHRIIHRCFSASVLVGRIQSTPRDLAELMKAYKKYDTEMLGPAPQGGSGDSLFRNS